MPRKLILILLLIFTLIPTAALAQVDDITQLNETTCSELDWAEMVEGIIAMLTTDQLEISGSIVTIDPMQRLYMAHTGMNTIRAACTGYTFTSDEYANGIIGPVMFTGSVYEGTLTVSESGGFPTMTFTSLSGECGLIPMLSIMSTETSDSSLFRFDQCTTMIEVNSRGPWTLSFSRIQ
jgi:hypothetical protein